MAQFVFEATKKQIEASNHVLNTGVDFVLFGGAIRGAKSIWLIAELLTLSIEHPNSRWLLLRKTSKVIERNLIPSINIVLDLGFKVYIQSMNNEGITLHNGSQIVIMAESYEQDKELNRFKGLEINGAGVDEINEIQEVTFYKIFERAGSWLQSKAPIKVIGTCNPAKNWVKSLVYDRYVDGSLPKNWRYVPAKITDNPFVPQSYIESLKTNMPAYQYQKFVQGDWDIVERTGGEFYREFNQDKQVRTDVEHNPNLPIWLSFDENVNPYLPCSVWQVEGKTAWKIDEIAAMHPNNTVHGICKIIKQRYGAFVENGVYITGDATSKRQDTKIEKGYNFFRLIQNELDDFKPMLRVPSKNPSVAMRGNFINEIFRRGLEDIDLIYSHECKHTIADLMSVKENSDGTKKKDKFKDPKTGVTYEKYGHFSDADDYFICFVFSAEFSIFVKGPAPIAPTIGPGTRGRKIKGY